MCSPCDDAGVYGSINGPVNEGSLRISSAEKCVDGWIAAASTGWVFSGLAWALKWLGLETLVR
jgi:hypothetical protein